MNLPDGTHTCTDCNNAVEHNDGDVGGPGPPPVGSSDLKPHDNGQQEIHRDEPNCPHKGHKVTKEGDQCCQKGDDDVVHQSDAESGKQVAFAETGLAYVTELHLEVLISRPAVDLQHTFSCFISFSIPCTGSSLTTRPYKQEPLMRSQTSRAPTCKPAEHSHHNTSPGLSMSYTWFCYHSSSNNCHT